jgi:hypothetical protein
MEQSFRGGKPSVFEATEAFSASGAQLAEYAGAYVSAEIDRVYRSALDGVEPGTP